MKLRSFRLEIVNFYCAAFHDIFAEHRRIVKDRKDAKAYRCNLEQSLAEVENTAYKNSDQRMETKAAAVSNCFFSRHVEYLV